MKLLTVYYSYGGNTKRVAELAHARLGGELVRIETAEPYAGNYDQVVEQGKREVERGFCPALKPLEIDWDAFDTVVLGMPVWWYTFAPAMHSFLKQAKLAGKTVYPFITSGGWPGHTLADVKKACPDSDVAHGLSIRFDGTRQSTPAAEVEAWLDGVKGGTK